MSDFFFNGTATTEIYTLSLHGALPISPRPAHRSRWRHRGWAAAGVAVSDVALITVCGVVVPMRRLTGNGLGPDRKSTRLNSSHANISYAVFCLKKKNFQRALRSRRPRV